MAELPGPVRSVGANHVALREQVLTELRRRIVDGEYREGERLTELRVAEDFGVSRNPVREALRVVEAEGFVDILPRRGAVVATLDEAAVRDLFAVRQQLETLAAAQAAERADPVGIAALRALIAEATASEDLDRIAELNSEFHRAVIDLSGNRWLQSMSTAMYHHVHRVFRTGAAHRAPHSSEEHTHLVDAIEAGDPETARKAAHTHVAAAAQAAFARRADATPAPGQRPTA
ncbi:GntR family transcriptional regulator [Kribbella sp. WER1]